MTDNIADTWVKRMQGVDLPAADWNRPVTHDDLQYLLDHYPYLQMISTDAPMEGPSEPKLMTADSGWVVHDYETALSSSPGQLIYGGYRTQSEEEGEGGGGAAINPGKGSIIKQAVDTAQQMVMIALQKGWPSIEIISGSELMKWAAWMKAEEQGLSVEGYAATKSGKAKRDRIQKFYKESVEGLGIKPRL